MDINHNLVKGCPLCEIFLDPKKNIKTKLYYPKFDEISKSDFVIINCQSCKVPMVVVRDHVTEISNDLWRSILYYSKREFGLNIKLRCRARTIKDHYHCHVIKPKVY